MPSSVGNNNPHINLVQWLLRSYYWAFLPYWVSCKCRLTSLARAAWQTTMTRTIVAQLVEKSIATQLANALVISVSATSVTLMSRRVRTTTTTRSAALCQQIKSEKLPETCEETTGSAEEDCDEDAMAYQTLDAKVGGETCYRLSNCVKMANKVKVGSFCWESIRNDASDRWRWACSTTCNLPLEYTSSTMVSGILSDRETWLSDIHLLDIGGNTCNEDDVDITTCSAKVKGRHGTYCSRTFTYVTTLVLWHPCNSLTSLSDWTFCVIPRSRICPLLNK